MPFITKIKKDLLQKAVNDFDEPKKYVAQFYEGSYFGIPLGDIFIAHSKAEAVYLFYTHLDKHISTCTMKDKPHTLFNTLTDFLDDIEEDEEPVDCVIDGVFENDTLWIKEIVSKK